MWELGEIVGNLNKLISGLILFIVGIVIFYETTVYNLLDFLLVIGFILAFIGIILMIGYFVDSSALKTGNLIKEVIKNTNSGNFSMDKWKTTPASEEATPTGPLRVRREFDNYDDDFYSTSYDDSVEEYAYSDDSKSVFSISNDSVKEVNFDNQLNFTPNYDKPLKVTRKPRKRKESSFSDYSYNINQNQDKSEEIKKALQEDNTVSEKTPTLIEPKEIKIDVNNPESLPIPKLLNSFILADNQLITSKDAFEQLSVYVNKEMMLEIPTLKGLSDRFLSHIPTIYSRLIIEDFDVSDISYIILISSLLKQGVHIKTIPQVNTINFIADDSHAMIISEGSSDNDVEYGAVYNDRRGISQIRASFEKTWEIADDLNMDIILKYMNKEGE